MSRSALHKQRCVQLLISRTHLLSLHCWPPCGAHLFAELFFLFSLRLPQITQLVVGSNCFYCYDYFSQFCCHSTNWKRFSPRFLPTFRLRFFLFLFFIWHLLFILFGVCSADAAQSCCSLLQLCHSVNDSFGMPLRQPLA